MKGRLFLLATCAVAMTTAHGDSLNCRLVGCYVTPSTAEGVAVVGSYAYVADDSAGLRVISVSDPAHPVEVGFYITAGYARGVAVVGNYAHVADCDAGLQVIEFRAPGIEEARKPGANGQQQMPTIVRGVLRLPVSPLTVHTALFDMTGRQVMALRPGPNDVSGLAHGVYFVRERGSGVQGFRGSGAKAVITE